MYTYIYIYIIYIHIIYAHTSGCLGLDEDARRPDPGGSPGGGPPMPGLRGT